MWPWPITKATFFFTELMKLRMRIRQKRVLWVPRQKKKICKARNARLENTWLRALLPPRDDTKFPAVRLTPLCVVSFSVSFSECPPCVQHCWLLHGWCSEQIPTRARCTPLCEASFWSFCLFFTYITSCVWVLFGLLWFLNEASLSQ